MPNPGQAPSPGMAAGAAIPTSPRWGEVERAARPHPTSQPGPSRREFLATAAAATGALVVGFWMPQRAAAGENPPGVTPATATWATDPAVDEVNAWVVVAPDDTVTIRIAQTELGQGVWTSNAMMVAEELQCDWSKVRPEYASANRDGREMAPDWTLHVPGKGATDPLGGGEPAIRRAQPARHHRHPRQPLPAHAHQRRRLGARRALLPAARRARIGASGCCAAASHFWRAGGGAEIRQRRDHPRANRAHRDLWPGDRQARQSAASAPGADPHQAARRGPEWILMGTKQRNLDVPLKVTGKTIYGIDVKLARHEIGGGAQLAGLSAAPWSPRTSPQVRNAPRR